MRLNKGNLRIFFGKILEFYNVTAFAAKIVIFMNFEGKFESNLVYEFIKLGNFTKRLRTTVIGTADTKCIPHLSFF